MMSNMISTRRWDRDTLQMFGREMMLAAMTGYGQDADQRQAAAAGFDRHLIKPVDLRALCDLLSSCAIEKIKPRGMSN